MEGEGMEEVGRAVDCGWLGWGDVVIEVHGSGILFRQRG
jgi:hypothetical protein